MFDHICEAEWSQISKNDSGNISVCIILEKTKTEYQSMFLQNYAVCSIQKLKLYTTTQLRCLKTKNQVPHWILLK